MATKLTPHSHFFIIVASIVLTISLGTSSNQSLGFTLPLIHIDSPDSPLYNPSLTLEQRMINACQRSFNRAKRLSKRISSPVIRNSGEYFMKLSIGTPKFDVWALADTGTDLSWIQCHPCVNCFTQVGPIFKPKTSSTYKLIPQNSSLCKEVHKSTSKFVGQNICAYHTRYLDSSYSDGSLSTDKFSFTSSTSNNQQVSFHSIIFGCGHDNGGPFSGRGTGVIGLGGRSPSLVTQLGKYIDFRFSYCLVPTNFGTYDTQSSSIRFGVDANVSGNGVIVAPMYLKRSSTHYYLKLVGMSVSRNRRIEFHKKIFGFRKREIIFIDSGSTWTFLPSNMYSKLKKDVMNAIGNIKPINTPSGLDLDLCYRAKDLAVPPPKITTHFEGGDIKLERYNTYVEINETICLTIVPCKDNFRPIYGVLAQQNFLVGYDLKRRSVSFKPMDCTKA